MFIETFDQYGRIFSRDFRSSKYDCRRNGYFGVHADRYRTRRNTQTSARRRESSNRYRLLAVVLDPDRPFKLLTRLSLPKVQRSLIDDPQRQSHFSCLGDRVNPKERNRKPHEQNDENGPASSGRGRWLDDGMESSHAVTRSKRKLRKRKLYRSLFLLEPKGGSESRDNLNFFAFSRPRGSHPTWVFFFQRRTRARG